jgi:hypothetical protein
MVSDTGLRRIPPRSWRRLGWACFVVGCLVTPIVLGVAYDAVVRRSWVESAGLVVAVEPASDKDVRVSYTYRVGGRTFTGREQRSRSLGLEPGAPLLVRYDPMALEQSTTRPARAEAFSAGVGLIGAAMAWGFAVCGLRFGRERRAAA